jgi:hypothetical protein
MHGDGTDVGSAGMGPYRRRAHVIRRPESFEHGGKLVGLVTTFGFGLAFALTMLE